MKTVDNFTELELNYASLDTFVIRNSILIFIQKITPQLTGRLLDFGCGKMPYRNMILEESELKEYIGLDIETALTYDSKIKPDFIWDGNAMPFSNEEFDCAMGTEVLEHCPDAEKVLKEVYRVLKTKGFIFGTVPFLWPLHETPHDEYRYTPFSLKRHLENAGFTKIEIMAHGGWHSSMAQMLGLWIKRSNMSSRKRKMLSHVIKPIMKKLLKLDQGKAILFKESQMVTGLNFTAYKISSS